MQVCFQLLDCDYTLINERPIIRLFGRTLDGQTVCAFYQGFKPYFYVQARDKEKVLSFLHDNFAAEVGTIKEVEKFLPIGFSQEKETLLKIVLKNPAKVPEVRDRLSNLSAVQEVFEADIPFRYRFMADHRIKGMTWYKVNGTPIKTDSVNTQLKLTIKQLESVEIDSDPDLRFLSFDIEVVPSREGLPDSSRDPIAIISLAFDPPFKGKKSLLLIAKKVGVPIKDIEPFDDETQMLQRFIDIVHEFDPHVMVGYNSDNFDLPYLVERLRRNNLPRTLGRCNRKPIRCRKVGTRFINSIPGRVVVDVYTMIREAVGKGLLRLRRYDLGSVAAELLGERKLEISFHEIRQYWNGTAREMQRLFEYARRDAQLTLDLLLKRRMLDKFIALARVSGLLLQDVLTGGESSRVENLLLREFNRRGFVVPDKPDKKEMKRRLEERKKRGLKGALVLKPDVGLHESCVVYLDFRSLYPSIFFTYNICPTTLLLKTKEVEHVTTPFGISFVAKKIRPGIFSEVVYRLVEERDKVRKEMAEERDEARKRVLNAKQIALKYMANAFYGYTGYIRARFYVLSMANAITSCGREILERTKKLVEERFGLRIVYGDTDSIQINTGVEDVAKAEGIGKEVVDMINQEFAGTLKMKIEGVFKTELILTKKRYVGWSWERVNGQWSDRIIAKGIETVRRDWCELTSQTLAKVLDIILKERDPEGALKYVREVLRKLQAGEIPIEQLVIMKGLTKSPHSYKGIQPHVELAKKLRKRSPASAPAVGDRIGFVIVKGPQLLSQRAEDPRWVVEHNLEVDARYYIENQLLPPLERVFEALGVERAQLLGAGKQLLLTDTLKRAVTEEILSKVDGFICDACGRSYVRPPLLGKCGCGGDLLFYCGSIKSRRALL